MKIEHEGKVVGMRDAKPGADGRAGHVDVDILVAGHLLTVVIDVKRAAMVGARYGSPVKLTVDFGGEP